MVPLCEHRRINITYPCGTFYCSFFDLLDKMFSRRGQGLTGGNRDERAAVQMPQTRLRMQRELSGADMPSAKTGGTKNYMDGF